MTEVANLNAGPSAILFVRDGDIVSVDGVLLTVKVPMKSTPDMVYLTTVDSAVEAYNEAQQTAGIHYSDDVVKYGDYIRHVRDREQRAMMTRSEMSALIKSGMYSIE